MCRVEHLCVRDHSSRTCSFAPCLVPPPAQIMGVVEHWPAFNRWRDPGYLLRVAGCRTVPVEVGSHYLAEEWRQDMARRTLPSHPTAPVNRAEQTPGERGCFDCSFESLYFSNRLSSPVPPSLCARR